ncbi:MAG TPA: alpha/beta fold hydrolase [Verrucomicrobiae bacterium]|nr:alpha/beta fold hydrolase [Verrucomicrobiae bacterium]
MITTRVFTTILAMAILSVSSPARDSTAISPNGRLESGHVILLHGICRTSRSMAKMQRVLTAAGYVVWNVDYPSRTALIPKLADDAIGKAIAQCRNRGAGKIDFVTHSMGGILVRSYLARHSVPDLGRVVMLAPPNQGSEIVDKLGGLKLFKQLHGPAGNELGTDRDSLPNQLGPAGFPVGIIAGDRSINWINSLFIIPGPDDGKVSVKRAKLIGMSDFIVIHATHTFITRNRQAIEQTIAFLRNGKFNGSVPSRRLKLVPSLFGVPA